MPPYGRRSLLAPVLLAKSPLLRDWLKVHNLRCTGVVHDQAHRNILPLIYLQVKFLLYWDGTMTEHTFSQGKGSWVTESTFLIVLGTKQYRGR